MIIINGENVYPREIEELLYAFPRSHRGRCNWQAGHCAAKPSVLISPSKKALPLTARQSAITCIPCSPLTKCRAILFRSMSTEKQNRQNYETTVARTSRSRFQRFPDRLIEIEEVCPIVGQPTSHHRTYCSVKSD